jgi:hypothetical protein
MIRVSSKWLAPKTKKSVDTFWRIPLKTAFYCSEHRELGKQRKMALKRFGAFNEGHHQPSSTCHKI